MRPHYSLMVLLAVTLAGCITSAGGDSTVLGEFEKSTLTVVSEPEGGGSLTMKIDKNRKQVAIEIRETMNPTTTGGNVTEAARETLKHAARDALKYACTSLKRLMLDDVGVGTLRGLPFSSKNVTVRSGGQTLAGDYELDAEEFKKIMTTYSVTRIKYTGYGQAGNQVGSCTITGTGVDDMSIELASSDEWMSQK